MKKGNPSYLPSNKLALGRKLTESLEKQGLHPRWVDRLNGDEVGRRQDQGYVLVNRETGCPSTEEFQGVIPGSTPTKHDLVLMAIPKEEVVLRNEYFEKQVKAREETIKRRAAQSFHEKTGGDPNSVYGKTEIQHKRTVID